MFREATPYGCLRLSRREALLALIGVASTPVAVPAQTPTGFRVTGIVTHATDTPEVFDIGAEFGLIAVQGTEPHRLLMELDYHRVTVHVDPT